MLTIDESEVFLLPLKLDPRLPRKCVRVGDVYRTSTVKTQWFPTYQIQTVISEGGGTCDSCYKCARESGGRDKSEHSSSASFGHLSSALTPSESSSQGLESTRLPPQVERWVIASYRFSKRSFPLAARADNLGNPKLRTRRCSVPGARQELA